MTNYNWRQLDIRIYAVAASLLISCFTILFPDTPNDDAFVYIRTAEIFQTQGVAAAFAHHSWATYSILIGLFAKIFGLELFTAAYLINAVFFALLTFSFISVAREIEESQRFLLLAALTVLLYPQLNEYRYAVVRDIGFWALAVFALWQFLLFSKERRIKNAIAYILALIIAASLRMEALLYLLLTPLALLFDHRFGFSKCTRDLLRLEGLILFLLLALTGALWVLGVDLFGQITEFGSTYLPFITDLFNPDEAKSFELANTLFNEHAATYSQNYINFFMLAGFSVILLIKLLHAIGIPLLFVLSLGAFKRLLSMPRTVFVPVLSYLLVNSLILLAFIYITQFLTSRYTILFCIMLALFVPIILFRFLQWGLSSDRVLIAWRLIALFFIYCTVDVFFSFGVDKTYIDDSVNWLADHAPDSASLLTNNHSIAYYSDRVENYDSTPRLINTAQITAAEPGSYLAVELHYEMEQILAIQEIASMLEFQAGFPDSDEQAIAIYKKVGP